MKPEDLIGKYATKCCIEDMFLISDIDTAKEVVEWDEEIADDCPSLVHKFADTLEQAKLMWTPHESVGG